MGAGVNKALIRFRLARTLERLAGEPIFRLGRGENAVRDHQTLDIPEALPIFHERLWTGLRTVPKKVKLWH
jgi:hypothetical protein